jgi:hypothetical protein
MACPPNAAIPPHDCWGSSRVFGEPKTGVNDSPPPPPPRPPSSSALDCRHGGASACAVVRVVLQIGLLWHVFSMANSESSAVGAGLRFGNNNNGLAHHSPPPDDLSAAVVPHTQSHCLAAVRNSTYSYQQWDNSCRELIGKGFKCFDVDALTFGDDSDDDGDGHTAAAAAEDAPLRHPLFIKLHKVGGTTLGDVLARVAGQLKVDCGQGGGS